MKKIYLSVILFLAITKTFSQGSCFSYTATTYPSGNGSFTPIIDDFNADGKMDYAGTSWGINGFFVYMGNGVGSFTAASGSPNINGQPLYGITSGDFNNDGKKDIVVSSTNFFRLYVGTGTGAFTPSTMITFGASGQRLWATSADFNNDGNLDVAFSYNGGPMINVYSGNGSGGFAIMGPNYAMQSGTWGIEKGDFNSDGNIDLVVSNNSGNINLLLGSPTGTFVNSTIFTGFPSPAQIKAADINNDGKLDFVVGAGAGTTIRACLGNGTGGFNPPFVINTVGLNSPYGVAVADFNLDGNLDIITNGWNSSNTAAYFGNGTGTFVNGTNNPIGLPGVTTQLHMASGDFNGDSKPDVVMAGQGSNVWAVLLNRRVTVSGPSSACGNTITLQASAASSYTWNTGAFTSSINVAPSSMTTYTVYGTSNGCTTNAIKTVSVGALTGMSVTSSSSVSCAGQSIVLTASGATTYSWNSSSGSQFFVAAPSVTTTYTLTGNNGSCTGSIVFTQSVVVCTGITALKNANGPAITAFPNPNNGEFTIATNINMDLNVMNELGQIVRTVSLNESNGRQTKIPDLPSGIYFVSDQSNKMVLRQKIVVTR